MLRAGALGPGLGCSTPSRGVSGVTPSLRSVATDAGGPLRLGPCGRMRTGQAYVWICCHAGGLACWRAGGEVHGKQET